MSCIQWNNCQSLRPGQSFTYRSYTTYGDNGVNIPVRDPIPVYDTTPLVPIDKPTILIGPRNLDQDVYNSTCNRPLLPRYNIIYKPNPY